jgi:hypothetical protein
MNITNTSTTALQWPDGTDLPTGKAVKVGDDAYNEHKDAAIIVAWVNRGILVVGKAKRQSDAEKDRLRIAIDEANDQGQKDAQASIDRFAE